MLFYIPNLHFFYSLYSLPSYGKKTKFDKQLSDKEQEEFLRNYNNYK